MKNRVLQHKPMTNQWLLVFCLHPFCQPQLLNHKQSNVPNPAKRQIYLLLLTHFHNLLVLVERFQGKHLKKRDHSVFNMFVYMWSQCFRCFYSKCCLPTLLMKPIATCHDCDRFLNKSVITFLYVILLHLRKKAKGKQY